MSTPQSSVRPVRIALLAIGVAWLVRWLLDPLLDFRVPYATFFVAVVFSAWFGGRRAALVALAVGAVVASFFFVPPKYGFLPRGLDDALGLAFFLFGGAAIAFMSSAMQDAEQRAERSAAQARANEGRLAEENAVRRRAEGELRAQHEWFRTTLNSIGDAVIATDTAGHVTLLNPLAERLTGWTQAEARGRGLSDVFRLLDEQTRAPVEDPVAKALRENRVVELANHTILVSKEGTEYAIDDSAAPIFDEAGKILGVVLIFRDVTERRSSDRERTYMAAIVRFSDDAIVGRSLDGTITSWNQGAERLYGYTAEEIIGRSIDVLIPPDRRDDFHADTELVRGGGSVEHAETVRRRKDGTLVNVALTLSPIRNNTGELIGISAVARDITARVETEERLRLALDAASMGTWDWNIATNEVRWSENLERIHGFAPGAFGGTFEAFRASVHADDRDTLDAAIGRSLETGSGYDIEYRDLGPDGLVRWMSGKGRVLADEEGRPVRMVGVCMDITARKQLESELRRSAEALREADRRKDEFLATLAHELRNPLAPLRNALEIMRIAEGDRERLTRARTLMERQLHQMVRLIDDLLDVSRISSGRIGLRKERIELRSAIESAIETSRPLIEECGHTLTVNLPAEPIWIDADLTRLSQVFANLLNNAAKYTDHGSITLTAARDGAGAEVRVTDTGVGIPAEALPSIFEMFSQVDRSLERTQGGLGIGLSLVRALVRLHDGSVEAHSEGAGHGSVFVVRLPVAEAPAAAVEGAASGPNGGVRTTSRKILVVDDNRDSADSLALMLGMTGNETRAEYDGAAALETARTFAPDAILLDIGLPSVNGYEIARRLRKQPWGRHVLLVAMTGWGQEEDKRNALEAGFDLHMTKPVDLDVLQRTIAELDGRKA